MVQRNYFPNSLKSLYFSFSLKMNYKRSRYFFDGLIQLCIGFRSSNALNAI